MQHFSKIIDNKKVSMTNDEFALYQNICRSYDRTNFKGEELFRDLFESDDNGIILLLKPPSQQPASIEIFLFLVSIFQQQHVRIMYDRVASLMEKMQNKLNQLEAESK